jgi:acyl dehydratase
MLEPSARKTPNRDAPGLQRVWRKVKCRLKVLRKKSGGVTTFDPKQFCVTERRAFDDLMVGEVFRNPSRTVTDAHFAAFQMISGDNHPIHYDIEFCRAHGHHNLLAHGFQVLAFSAVGAGSFSHMIGDKLIGFIEQSSKFLKPVYVGDTLYAIV